MDIEFVNPGVDYMIQRIVDFQTEAESAFWSEPLYRFYPQLDKAYAISLPFSERNEYIERTMRAVYAESEDTINEKALYIFAIGTLVSHRLQQLYRMPLTWIVPTYLTTYGAI